MLLFCLKRIRIIIKQKIQFIQFQKQEINGVCYPFQLTAFPEKVYQGA